MLGKKLEERVEDCRKHQASQAEKARAEDFHSGGQSASSRKDSGDSCRSIGKPPSLFSSLSLMAPEVLLPGNGRR